jgi:hypothetical protein
MRTMSKIVFETAASHLVSSHRSSVIACGLKDKSKTQYSGSRYYHNEVDICVARLWAGSDAQYSHLEATCACSDAGNDLPLTFDPTRSIDIVVDVPCFPSMCEYWSTNPSSLLSYSVGNCINLHLHNHTSGCDYYMSGLRPLITLSVAFSAVSTFFLLALATSGILTLHSRGLNG